VVGDGFVDVGDAGDVDDDDFGAVGADAAQELVGELLGAWAVEDADDGEDEESFADLEYGGGQFADGVLLLADDAFALFDEADGDGVGDAVGGGFVGVEDAVEQVEVGAPEPSRPRPDQMSACARLRSRENATQTRPSSSRQ
jgi:hypothetical protein